MDKADRLKVEKVLKSKILTEYKRLNKLYYADFLPKNIKLKINWKFKETYAEFDENITIGFNPHILLKHPKGVLIDILKHEMAHVYFEVKGLTTLTHRHKIWKQELKRIKCKDKEY